MGGLSPSSFVILQVKCGLLQIGIFGRCKSVRWSKEKPVFIDHPYNITALHMVEGDLKKIFSEIEK
jgi:hypothetical protein